MGEEERSQETNHSGKVRVGKKKKKKKKLYSPRMRRRLRWCGGQNRRAGTGGCDGRSWQTWFFLGGGGGGRRGAKWSECKFISENLSENLPADKVPAPKAERDALLPRVRHPGPPLEHGHSTNKCFLLIYTYTFNVPKSKTVLNHL